MMRKLLDALFDTMALTVPVFVILVLHLLLDQSNTFGGKTDIAAFSLALSIDALWFIIKNLKLNTQQRAQSGAKNQATSFPKTLIAFAIACVVASLFLLFYQLLVELKYFSNTIETSILIPKFALMNLVTLVCSLVVNITARI